jgi:NAD(P)-dependent dehydrogenase (short-subunit alcohol dehydrogenase family)
MNITGNSILITGANRGIGLALVAEALNRGAKRVYAAVRGTFQHAGPRVTILKLDVTSESQIQQAAREVDALDVLINNAGVALYDDLSNPDALAQQMAVNLYGPFQMIRAFLPQLRHSKGAIVNNVSLAALAALPIMPGYSISKAAAFSLTQSWRALLASEGVSVHAAIIGPTDTEMNRGLNIPKASAETTAKGILDGIEKGEEDIFPDPASQSIADGWRNGVVKAMEHQFAGFVPASIAKVA